jgi:stage V sporulation protein B
MAIIILSASFISNTLLHEKRTYYPILAIGLVLPFISISSILRGYFFGKQKCFPHVLSNIVEDITRLITIILFVPFFIKKGITFAVTFLVLSNIISELSSILILFIFLPKNEKLTKDDIKPDLSNIKDILEISIPTTTSRLIGCIGLFFEPIILTHFLSNDYLVLEYGILNGYVMPLILLPSFFTSAISQALLPVVSNAYSNNNKKYVLKKIKQAIFYSLLIGLPATIIFITIPDVPLKLIYNTNEGINYIKFLAPICLLHYIQSPLTSSLQAMNKASCAMKATLTGMILRTLFLIIFCYLNFGIWSLILESSINIIYVTIHHIVYVLKYLKKRY